MTALKPLQGSVPLRLVLLLIVQLPQWYAPVTKCAVQLVWAVQKLRQKCCEIARPGQKTSNGWILLWTCPASTPISCTKKQPEKAGNPTQAKAQNVNENLRHFPGCRLLVKELPATITGAHALAIKQTRWDEGFPPTPPWLRHATYKIVRHPLHEHVHPPLFLLVSFFKIKNIHHIYTTKHISAHVA